MGTNLNFKNFANEPSFDTGGGGGDGVRPPGSSPLTRQPSIYSLTFDEFQSTMGGLGKEFGSMNMDELLKNIWSAEENQQQTTAATSSGVQEGLQRQGSLTLPRTLSQKTVDEVWRDISREFGGGSGSGTGGADVPQRQQTLREITLEEFLLRAGVVREDTQLAGKINTNGVFFGDLSQSVNNSALGIGFQPSGGVVLSNTAGNQIPMQSSNLPLSVHGVRSNQAQAQAQAQAQQQQIYPKQPNVGYMSQLPLQSSSGIRGGMMGIGDQGISGGLMQAGGVGMVGLGIATGSPVSQPSSDGIGKSNGDKSSVSPVPYVFNGSLRGKRAGGAVEKVAERRQKRMIKNRESAARSRARKQAYTTELEAEVAKLKQENQALKKQAEILEIKKNQMDKGQCMAMKIVNQTCKWSSVRRKLNGNLRIQGVENQK